MTNWSPPNGQPQQPSSPYVAPGPVPHYSPNQWGPPAGSQYNVGTLPRLGNGIAVASLVLGITSIVFCWWGLLTLLQVILAITFGGVGISKANRGAAKRGFAVAGLVLGICGLVIYFFIGLFSWGVGWVV